ncbi:uncharacterized protein LOC141617775 [Silene latifolia]|uniref:uncharacterized protein LOC141617775 n=1 Tax=Silene latifolia TaxID=37657 RepID=UPI003D76C438
MASISACALGGVENFQTMRVMVLKEKKPLHVLVDSESSHNFLDQTTAEKMGYKLERVPPIEVSVVDGNTLKCEWMCRGFTWKLQQGQFKGDFFLIPLGNCDMVLGIQWLSKLGPIIWDLHKLTMEFTYQGELVTPQGQGLKNLKITPAKEMERLIQNEHQIAMLQVRTFST